MRVRKTDQRTKVHIKKNINIKYQRNENNEQQNRQSNAESRLAWVCSKQND